MKPPGSQSLSCPNAIDTAGAHSSLRFRRRHPRVRGLARQARTVAVVLGRHGHHRSYARRRPEGPGRRVDAGGLTGRRDPRQHLGRRNRGRLSQELAAGIRMIVRKGRPHFTDAEVMRLTCFATNTQHTPIAALELRPPASGPEPRTASAPREPPALPLCLCTTPRRTRSGWRSSRSRSTCWPGCRCSHPCWPRPALGAPTGLRLRLFSAPV